MTPMPLHEELYAFFSMQRSGTHAVIDHLCRERRGIVHLNHCDLRGWFRRAALPITNRVIEYGEAGVRDFRAKSSSEIRKLTAGAKSLAYSFENKEVRETYLRPLPPAKRKHLVVILRDPYNWLASHYKFLIDRRENAEALLSDRLRLWRSHVHTATTVSELAGFKVTGIVFNRWISEPDYVGRIFASFGIQPASLAPGTVPKFGGGSSFDKYQFRENPEQMRVCDRWKFFRQDPLFRRLLENPELARISETVFHFPEPAL